jgi:ketosteroid isomerase-like protein
VPEAADVAASGDLAWSWGYARWTASDGSGKTGTSNYVSIWRKQADGAWKWIVDIGIPAPPKPSSLTKPN